jgi:hypothetical protein
MNIRNWALAAALLSSGMAQATCYSVYWSDGALAIETSIPPVNLSMPLGEALADTFGPGMTMVVSDQAVYCGKQQEVAVGRPSLAEALRQETQQAGPANKAQSQPVGVVKKAEMPGVVKTAAR